MSSVDTFDCTELQQSYSSMCIIDSRLLDCARIVDVELDLHFRTECLQTGCRSGFRAAAAPDDCPVSLALRRFVVFITARVGIDLRSIWSPNGEQRAGDVRCETSELLLFQHPKAEDAEALGVICFNAFKTFNESVNLDYTLDFHSVEFAVEVIGHSIEGPEKALYGAVAVDDDTGLPIGSGFLHHSDSDIYSIGPLSVDPYHSSHGAGRKIMTRLLDRAKQEGATSVRLIQVTPNTTSFALYTSLGFVGRDCFAVFWGTVEPQRAAAAASALGLAPDPDAIVRHMEEADVAGCSQLFKETNGYSRLPGIQRSRGPSAWVATSKSGDILAYTTGFDAFQHTVAKSEDDFIALFLGVAQKAQIKFLLTISNGRYVKLAQWAVAAKLRLNRHNWYMVIGDYKAPKDNRVYLPSVMH